MILRQIAARTFVYGAGFAQVFFLAHILGKSTFGEFSYFQGAIELAVILCTLGSALIFTRLSALAPHSYFSLSATLRPGIPLAACALFAFIALGPRSPRVLEVCALYAIVIAQATNQLLLYQLRGRGGVLAFTLEPGARSFLVVGLLALLYFLTEPTLLTALLSVLIALFSSTLWLTNHSKIPPLAKEAGPTVREQLSALPTSLAMFVAKKADLLLIGIFASGATIANFKIAFLLAEIPYQMAQLIIIRESQFLSSISSTASSERLRGIVLHVGCVAAVFALVACGMAYFADVLLLKRYDLLDFLPGLLGYFLLKSFSSIAEAILFFSQKYAIAFQAACISSLLKILLLAGVAADVLNFNLAYVCLGVTEGIAYLCFYARHRAASPTLRTQ